MELTRIKKLLVPAAWVLIGSLALMEIMMLVTLFSGWGFIPDNGLATLSVALAFVLGLAIVWAGERPLALVHTALAVTAVAALALVITWIVPAVGALNDMPQLAILAQVAYLISLLAVQVLVVVLLWRLRELVVAQQSVPALPGAEQPALPQASATGQAPTWQPDRAAGAAWHTAGAAASGAAAADWGRPGERGGWTAPPRQPQDFGPAATGPQPDPDVTRVASEFGSGGSAGFGRVEPLRPEEIALRYAEQASQDPDMTRMAPPGTGRKPPRWTPMGDPAQRPTDK
ncbi:MAG: hypothetical protein Q4G46_03965 [Propionibacteriaceae bacterium]|nr:hypothetical protein [Propionibacteriaceae bacterium]